MIPDNWNNCKGQTKILLIEIDYEKRIAHTHTKKDKCLISLENEVLGGGGKTLPQQQVLVK